MLLRIRPHPHVYASQRCAELRIQNYLSSSHFRGPHQRCDKHFCNNDQTSRCMRFCFPELNSACMRRLSETTTKRGKKQREREGDRGDTRRDGFETRASSRGITEERFHGRRDVTYVTQYARCRLCPGHLFGREARASGRAHSTRLALSKERTGSAPALITPRRRSYFTPRSSIIHAVNNAPLFRVTLYRLFFLPLFPSPPPHPVSARGCEGARVAQELASRRYARRIGHSYLQV